MPRLAVLAALGTLIVAVLAAEAATPSFPYGVTAGEVTSTSAILWTRAPRSGEVELVVSTSRVVPQGPPVRGGRAQASTDRTVSVRVDRLSPATRYFYVFSQGGLASEIGTFTTAPAPTAAANVRFAISGDADATPGSNGKPGFNRFEVYARMAAEKNYFNINLGDTIYSDSEVGGAAVARTVAQKWGKYKLGLALPALRKLRASAGLYSHWDDHEFVNDFARAEDGQEIYTAGVKAFRDYSPVAYNSKVGLYRTVRWGKHLELFFLDERSFRSTKSTTACNGDLAPTVPQAVRDAFATLAPALKNPVPAACLSALNDPARTMLGAAQYAAFTKAIKASNATWKVIVNDGSAGYVFDGDPTASWALIDIVDEQVTAEIKRTVFDTLAVANAISARGLAGDVYRAATVRTGKLVR